VTRLVRAFLEQPGVLRAMGISAAIGGILALLISFGPYSTYTAEVLLLLDTQDPTGGALGFLSASTGLASQVFGGSIGDEKSGHTFQEIIRSRWMLDRLLSRTPPGSNGATYLDYFCKARVAPNVKMEKGRRAIGSCIESDFDIRSDVFRISATANDPRVAADMANFIAAQLASFNATQRSSRSRSTREFLEARLGDSQQALHRAEATLVEFREANARFGNSPLLLMRDKALNRDMLIAEESYSFLKKEYEMASIQEKKNSPVFTIVDPAIPPARPKGVHPIYALLMGVFLGGMSSALISVIRSRDSFVDRIPAESSSQNAA
jgi:hypothetical protein